MTNKWNEFWRQKNEFDNSMEVNYAHFLKRINKYVQPNKDSIVLDIGSGPGYLEDAWFDRVKEIHGIDISERYNKAGREKHRNHPNVFFHDLIADDYLNFSIVGGKKFNIIIVMSVLQYYQNKEEVVQLLKNIRSLAAPGAKVLLCDLIVEHSMMKELFEVLREYWKAGKFLFAISLFFRLRFSPYYRVKKNQGFLILSVEEWKQILTHLKIKGEFIKDELTLQKSRKNILITID